MAHMIRFMPESRLDIHIKVLKFVEVDRFSPGSGIDARFFDEQLGSAVGATDYVSRSWNWLLTPIPLSIRRFDFCDCLASTLGW